MLSEPLHVSPLMGAKTKAAVEDPKSSVLTPAPRVSVPRVWLKPPRARVEAARVRFAEVGRPFAAATR